MNFSQIYTDICSGLGEVPPGFFSVAQVKSKINEVYQDLCLSRNFRFSVKENSLLIPVTQLSSAVVVGAAVLPVDSASGFGKNRIITVTDGANFERFSISSITGNNITISGTLVNAYAIDSYVILDKLFFPADMGFLISAYIKGDNRRELTLYREYLLPKDLPDRLQIQDLPQSLYFQEKVIDSEGDLVLTTGTSTTSAVCSTALNSLNNYYTGWYLLNKTRLLKSRVTTYTASTNTLALETPITGQVTIDTFQLRPYLDSFVIYPYVNASTTLYLAYRAKPAPLVNDYDEPIIAPEKKHNLIVYGTLAELFALKSLSPNAMTQLGIYKNLFESGLGDLERKSSTAEGESIQQVFRRR